MTIGAVRDVDVDGCEACYYLDTGMYDTEGYGSVYIIDADRPAIVDSGIGTNYESILAALDELGIDREELGAIALTHIHLDHAGGAGFLAEACPNAEIYVPSVGAGLLVEPDRLVEGTRTAVGAQWQFYTEPEPLPEDRVVEIDDGDVIDLGDHSLEVYGAPGHAFHQVVFYDPTMSAMFVADAAGIWLPEREEIVETSPPNDFDLEGCLADLETIREVDPDVLCYTHFGPREVGDDLEAAIDEYERVLTEWVEEVEAAYDDLGEEEAVVEHFAESASLPGVWNDRKVRDEAAMNARGVLEYLRQRD